MVNIVLGGKIVNYTKIVYKNVPRRRCLEEKVYPANTVMSLPCGSYIYTV